MSDEPATEVFIFHTKVESVETFEQAAIPPIHSIKVEQIAAKFNFFGDPPNLKIGDAVDFIIRKADAKPSPTSE
jgi:hypothetical protein